MLFTNKFHLKKNKKLSNLGICTMANYTAFNSFFLYDHLLPLMTGMKFNVTLMIYIQQSI